MPDEIDESTRGLSLSSIGAPNWRRFFDQHWKFVTRVVQRFGGRGIDVEDAVQDVFLILFQRLHEFEGQAQLTTWIYRVCANVGSEHRRRRTRQARLQGLLKHLPFVSADSRTPAQDAETRDEWQHVERILASMSPKRREAFILCELEQLSGEEAAQILNIPMATVRTRVHYARQDFLRHLELNR